MDLSEEQKEALEVIEAYEIKYKSAYEFANEDPAMYLLGLAMNGLDLVPPGTLLDIKSYWRRAPILGFWKSLPDPYWEHGSYVVEIEF